MKSFAVFLSALLLVLASACSLIPVTGMDLPPTAAPTAILSPTVPVVLPTATPEPTASPLLDEEQVAQQLYRAIESRDFTTIRALMADRFSIATWNTQLLEFPSDEALDMLRQTQLSEGAQPAVRFGADVPAILEGADPLEQWGPVADVVRAVHVMGLGANAADEAIIVIGRDAAGGRFYWHGILLPAAGGYFKATNTTPQPVFDTDVKSVVALDELNVRTGPGTQYASIGRVRPGEVAQVTGRDAEGGWWRIFCTNDASGHCWITADPTLTEPVTSP